jgi:hypothetical protein
MWHPPDKPNPTTGQDGRVEGFNKSSGGLSKQNKNYAFRTFFARPADRNDFVLAWYAVGADSLVIGHYRTRPEAAQASGVRL